MFIGFAILFGAAAIFRLFSFYFLSGMYEPPFSKDKEERQSLSDMVRHVGSSNLGRFTLYVSLINFTTNIAGPFFAVYMLRDLAFSYAAYIVNASAFAIVVLVFQSFWGRRADWAGNIRVIAVTSLLLPIVPLLWLFSSNVYYLIGAQVFSGIAWAGFNLTSVNFVYDATEKEGRTKYIAFFNAASGLGLCLGALVGGYVAAYLPSMFGYQLRTLFLLSGLLRIVVIVLLLRLIFEVRHVPKMNLARLLRGNSRHGGGSKDKQA